MTKEEERLLLEDLSGRLSCEVIIQVYFEDISADGYFDEELWSLELDGESVRVNDRWIENIKPYLRPISSMTEEEKDKLFDILQIDKDGNTEDWIRINGVMGIRFFFPAGKYVEDIIEAYDYLNSIHIDYRGLIGKGLALEAPKNMYKND